MTPVIPSLRTQKQVSHSEFKFRASYTMGVNTGMHSENCLKTTK